MIPLIMYEKLFTFIRADNVAALATYLNQGFHIVGTAKRQAKSNGMYVDEIVIERFLYSNPNSVVRCGMGILPVQAGSLPHKSN